MTTLTRIDERTLNIVKHLEILNGRVNKHDGEIDSLKESRDIQKGEGKVHGWIAGIASSVVVGVLISFFKK